MRHPENWWLFPLIAWIAMSISFAAPLVKRIDWSHGALWKAIGLVLLAPFVGAISILAIGVIFLGLTAVAEFFWRRKGKR